jgi:hypothetical protein
MHGQCDSVSLFVAAEARGDQHAHAPPPSTPSATGQRPAQTTAAEPLEEPPAIVLALYGFLVDLHIARGRRMASITQRFRHGAETGREKKKRRVPVVRVDAAGAGAELVHVGLAGEYSPAGAQLRDARRVGLAAPRRAQPPRPARGRVRQAVDLVLHTHQHAVQRGQRRPCTHTMSCLSCPSRSLAADQRNE